MKAMHTTKSGFTIVELLIVIVVIALLATISVIAFRGVQARARDSIRTDNMALLRRSLELYRADYGRYPSPTANPGYQGWEVSTDAAGTFMEYLGEYGLSGKVPVDPINNDSGPYRYYYYRYSAGTYGCDASRGSYFVLALSRVESNPSSPGFSCSGRNWGAEFPWVIGGYEN